jgi:hypothetical protein
LVGADAVAACVGLSAGAVCIGAQAENRSEMEIKGKSGPVSFIAVWC